MAARHTSNNTNMGSEGDKPDDKAASKNEDAGARDGQGQNKNGPDGGSSEASKHVDDHDKTSDGDHQGNKKDDSPRSLDLMSCGEEDTVRSKKSCEDDSGSVGENETSGVVKGDGKHNEDHSDDKDSTNPAKEDGDKKEAKVVRDQSGTAPAGEGEAKGDNRDGTIEVRQYHAPGL